MPDTQNLPRAKAQARHVSMTPRKARRVVDLVRGRSAVDAASILKFAPQAAAGPVAKLLASAVANAEHNQGLDPQSLIIDVAYVDEGPTLKRFQPRAQGRAFRINKRTCHITIEVVALEAPTGRAARAGRGRGDAAAAPAGRGRRTASAAKGRAN